MYLTPQERAVQSALDAFWYEHYTKELTTDQRNQLADEFAEKWLVDRKFKIDRPFIRHPATKRRSFKRQYTVAEVLADFIIRADQVAEREEEYPVGNPDYEATGSNKRKHKELSLHFKDDLDKPKEERDPLPPYYVRANDIKLPNSVEDELFKETAPDVEQFRKELRRVKQFPEFYATTFAEEYNYDKKEALRRIKKLDLSRVRECRICGSAFYAHDLRRHVCDMQRGIKVHKEKGKAPVYEVTEKESACELERNRQARNMRYLADKKSI